MYRDKDTYESMYRDRILLYLLFIIYCVECIPKCCKLVKSVWGVPVGTDDVRDTNVRKLFKPTFLPVVLGPLNRKLLMYVLFIIEHERKEEIYRDIKEQKRIHNIYQNIKKIAYVHTDGYVFIKLTHTHKNN